MATKMKYGEIAFLAGVVLALVVGVLSGFIPQKTLLLGILGLLGLVVGLVNIREKEVTSFLVAAIAFLVAGNGLAQVLQLLTSVGEVGATLSVAIQGVVSAIAVFVSPAAFIVALKAIYDLTQKE